MPKCARIDALLTSGLAQRIYSKSRYACDAVKALQRGTKVRPGRNGGSRDKDWLSPFVAISGIAAWRRPGVRARGWIKGSNNKARLVAGARVTTARGPLRRRRDRDAGRLEDLLAVAGRRGGVPPRFDWQGRTISPPRSVLYPAPQRCTDKAGDTVGYKNGVCFPYR